MNNSSKKQIIGTFNFQNFGITHENNLNLIGLALSSRKISHDIPISIDIEANLFVKKLGPEVTNQYAEQLEDLWMLADDLGLCNKKVYATVNVLDSVYKVLFTSYRE